jgi:hypothetical protein
MMKIALACLFLAAVATSLPSDSFVPETEFAAVDMTEAHEAAQKHIQELLESGKSDDECKKLADAGIKTVTDSISASQKALDALETGKSCKGLQQALVDSSKKTLDDAKSADSAATTAADSAKKAPVKFADINIAQVKANDCAAFHADPAYISAKKASTAADKKKAETSGALKVAQKAYDDAVAAQKKAIQECSCKAQNAMLKEVPAAEKAYAATADEWKKAHLMKCVLGGTALSSCNVPNRPALNKPSLVEPAKSASCGSGSGPAPVSTACTCIPCGKSTPQKYGGGACAPATSSCSATSGTSGGCYSSAKIGCDCGTLNVLNELWVRTTTVNGKNSATGNKPTVVLTGSSGEYKGTLDSQSKGGTKTKKFKASSDIGSIKSITLKAAGTDGWEFSKVEAKTSQHNTWVTLFCKKAWLDGKPYDNGYSGLPYGDSLKYDAGSC